MLIDIHTHDVQNSNDTISIPSYRFAVENINNGKYKSSGIHPWDSDKYLEIKEFTEIAKGLFAISEIGLDYLHPNIEVQKEVFISQLEIAKANNKCVVIHAVKSHNEVQKIIKNYPSVTKIIHSFIGNKIIAQKYIELGCYLSFSPLSFKSNKGVESLKSIPLERLFLESDATGISIRDIYDKCSLILEVDMEHIEKQIFDNFTRIFNKDV